MKMIVLVYKLHIEQIVEGYKVCLSVYIEY